MTTARDVMHAGAQCIGEQENLQKAAQMMRDLDVGSLPICGRDNKLKGIVTDRDIVLNCCADGRDPATVTAGEFAQGLEWIEADADVEEALTKMEGRQIRRLPVIENQELVGVISEADLAQSLPEDRLAQFVQRIYAGQ